MGRIVLIVPRQDNGYLCTGVKEHLGIGYLAGALREAGHVTEIIDAQAEGIGPAEAAHRISGHHPDLIGISVSIASLHFLKDLLDNLVLCGCGSHIAIGGHPPTHAAEHFLDTFPRIDSVCRGEGEQTVCHLVDALCQGHSWKGVPGLSYRTDTMVVHNRRPSAIDLDHLAWPQRDSLPQVLAAGMPAAVVTSRGCPWQCGYCSVPSFYRESGGLWRARSPEDVAHELLFLQREYKTELFFIMNDDNFFGHDKGALKRVREFEKVFRGENLQVVFNISLRPEQARSELLLPLRNIGLRTVFLGVESGTDTGLKNLGRTGSVKTSHRALKVLERLGIGYQIGFIMFRPQGTLEEFQTDVDFLTRLVSGGNFLVDSYPFDRDYLVLPDTRLAKQLSDHGLRVGNSLAPTYRNTDERVRTMKNFCRTFIDPVFRPRFGDVTKRLASTEGRRELRALHLEHLGLLEKTVSMIAAGVSRTRLEKFGTALTSQ